MLDLEKLMECVTEFNEISKAAEEENKKLEKKQEQPRQQKLEELFEFLKPYCDVARKVSVRIYVEPFIKVDYWTYGIRIDSYNGKYGYGIYHHMDNDKYFTGYIEKKEGHLDFKCIARNAFSSEELFENYIDGILLHKDIFEEKFEEAIHKEMMRQTQDLKEKREKLLKKLE